MRTFLHWVMVVLAGLTIGLFITLICILIGGVFFIFFA